MPLPISTEIAHYVNLNARVYFTEQYYAACKKRELLECFDDELLSIEGVSEVCINHECYVAVDSIEGEHYPQFARRLERIFTQILNRIQSRK